MKVLAIFALFVSVSLAEIYINEALVHSEPPETDWIELWNTGKDIVDVSLWYLADSLELNKYYRFPKKSRVRPNSYIVVEEAQLGYDFDQRGETMVLMDADFNIIHNVTFGASPAGISFGRYVTSDQKEHFVFMSNKTMGEPNSYPRVGPLVISEISYNPADISYIVIENLSDKATALYHPLFPKLIHRVMGLNNYTFPPNTILGPKRKLVIPSVPESEFRQKKNVPDYIKVLPPFKSFDLTSLSLMRPDNPPFDSSSVPYYAIDEITNSNVVWQTTGTTLTRINNALYAEEPANWGPLSQNLTSKLYDPEPSIPFTETLEKLPTKTFQAFNNVEPNSSLTYTLSLVQIGVLVFVVLFVIGIILALGASFRYLLTFGLPRMDQGL